MSKRPYVAVFLTVSTAVDPYGLPDDAFGVEGDTLLAGRGLFLRVWAGSLVCPKPTKMREPPAGPCLGSGVALEPVVGDAKQDDGRPPTGRVATTANRPKQPATSSGRQPADWWTDNY